MKFNLFLENYIFSHRYSINVRQFSQSQDAFSFYNQLKSFSSSDNVFPQVQPGFIEGNMKSTTNANLPVIGYFEVASVTENEYTLTTMIYFQKKRYHHILLIENLGNPRLWPQGYHCESLGVCDGNCDSPLIEALLANQIVFAAENGEDFTSPYFTLPSACGDCTLLGSNVKPDFWIE